MGRGFVADTSLAKDTIIVSVRPAEYVRSAAEVHRDTHALIASDQCVIDVQWFFIRGCLEFQLLALARFSYGDCGPRFRKTFTMKSQAGLKTEIAINASVHDHCLGIEEDEHILVQEQTSGISPTRAMELASLLIHQEP